MIWNHFWICYFDFKSFLWILWFMLWPEISSPFSTLLAHRNIFHSYKLFYFKYYECVNVFSSFFYICFIISITFFIVCIVLFFLFFALSTIVVVKQNILKNNNVSVGSRKDLIFEILCYCILIWNPFLRQDFYFVMKLFVVWRFWILIWNHILKNFPQHLTVTVVKLRQIS